MTPAEWDDPEPAAPNAHGVLVGATLGSYRIESLLGAGGMGEVYLARDVHLPRHVALKVLLPDRLTDTRARRQLRREAMTLSRLSHPNIATIHGFESHDGLDIIVMEHVTGETLGDRVTRGALDERDVCRLGIQLMRGLSAGHQQDIVHGDIKSRNIRVTPDGHLKILDYGLARWALDAVSGSTHTPTFSPGEWWGTPAYMAPEQFRGHPPDKVSDIYSAGVVLYELATGRRPFTGRSTHELAREVLNQRPPSPRTFNAALSAAMEALILKALEKDRQLRYQAADDLLVDLRRLQTGLTGSPEASTARTEAPRAFRVTRRGLLFAGGAVVLAIASFGAFARRTGGGPRTISSLAVLPLDNLSAESNEDYLVDGMTDDLINMLGRLGTLRVIARTSVMKFKDSKHSLPEIAKELGVDAILEGTVTLVRSSSGRERAKVRVDLVDPATQSQLWSTTIERDLSDVLALQGEIAATLASEIRLAVRQEERTRLGRLRAVDPEAYKLVQLGRQAWNRRTAADVRVALSYFEQAVDRDQSYAAAYACVGDAYCLLAGDYGAVPVETGASKATDAALRALRLDPTLAEAYTTLAFANFFLRWDWQTAGSQFRHALDLNPNYATAHHWYGDYLSAMGREDEALEQMRTAARLDPLSEIISRDVAWPLFFAGRYVEAEHHLQGTLSAHPGYPAAQRLLGRTLVMQGRFDDALRLLVLLAQRADQPRARWDLAWAYAVAGRREDALRERQQARKSSVAFRYDDALVLCALGRADEALSALEAALEERDPTLVNLKHDPRLAVLREAPRFTAMLARMKLQ